METRSVVSRYKILILKNYNTWRILKGDLIMKMKRVVIDEHWNCKIPMFILAGFSKRQTYQLSFIFCVSPQSIFISWFNFYQDSLSIKPQIIRFFFLRLTCLCSRWNILPWRVGRWNIRSDDTKPNSCFPFWVAWPVAWSKSSWNDYLAS